jgi:pyruvate-formate lyase-activating enzyme
MDSLSKQLTLSWAYDVSAYVSKASVDQLFWALDRFHYDIKDIDEGAHEQRFEATQKCALELDRRNIPMRNPTIEVEFPRIFPDMVKFKQAVQSL